MKNKTLISRICGQNKTMYESAKETESTLNTNGWIFVFLFYLCLIRIFTILLFYLSVSLALSSCYKMDFDCLINVLKT